MNKTIEGVINFKLEITNEHTDINFNSSIDNDIAVMVICQYLLESSAIGLRREKENTKGDKKKIASEQLQCVLSGRQGLRTLVGLFLDNYDMIKEQEGKEKKITVESGKLSQEEYDAIMATQKAPPHEKDFSASNLSIVKSDEEPSADESISNL